MSSQLWRTVLGGPSLSADEQEAAPDERGSYGELTDAIDEIIASEAEDETARKRSRRRAPKRSGRSKRPA